MLDQIVAGAPVVLLIAVRCFAFIMTMPLFSMRSVPRIAKIALAGFMAFLVYSSQMQSPDSPFAAYGKYIAQDGSFDWQYVLLLIGEGLLGIIMGFYVSIIFSIFSTAGQFMAFQMGLSAAEAYDSLSQVENPLMGQFLNLVAMLTFLQNKWAVQIFTRGLTASFRALNVFDLISHEGALVKFLMHSLSTMFLDALIISLPIMGTLMLISVAVGILGKAAPQMNLLSEGFPIMLLVSFMLLMALIPSFFDFFTRSFVSGFQQLEQLFVTLHGGPI